MRIARKFKQLTKYTYPHGTEKGLLSYLPLGYEEDGLGNYFIKVGESSTMFTCHLDTACSKKEKVNHIQIGNMIGTDGKTILGADDKAGMVVILYMIENKIPGLYYFFVGEEVGCVGSSKLAEIWDYTDFCDDITKVISFDRRGTKSVITEQGFGRCCSDEFAIDLSNRLNSTGLGFSFEPDPTGIYTDSAKFMGLVPECTNISVGYYDEHMKYERQDIEFLQRLCKGVCKVDWESLPIVRDHNEEEDFYNSWLKQATKSSELSWSGGYSYFLDGGIKKIFFISDQQIRYEELLISNWLKQSDIYSNYDSFDWDGQSLYIDTKSYDKIKKDYVGDRSDLVDFIEDLRNVLDKHLKKSSEYVS